MIFKQRLDRYYNLHKMIQKIQFCFDRRDIIDIIYDTVEIIIHYLDIKDKYRYNNNKLICKTIKLILDYIDNYNGTYKLIELKLYCITNLKKIIVYLI